MGLKLQNNCINNEEANGSLYAPYGYILTDLVYQKVLESGHTYYSRLKVKYTDFEGTPIDYIRAYIDSWDGTGNARTPNNPVSDTWYTISDINKVNRNDGSYTLSVWVYPAVSYERTGTLYVKEYMVVDITALYNDFPYFNRLTKEEQKQLLDEALPYIEGSGVMEFNGFLRNWIKPEDNSSGWTGDANTYSIKEFYYRYGPAVENSFFYGRFEFRYSKDSEDAVNYDWARIHADGGNYAIVSIYNLEPDKSYIGSGVVSLPIVQAGGNRCVLYAGDEEHVGNKTPKWKNILVLNLYQDGPYLFFRLLGLEDEDIKTYLDTIPFFVDTYDIGSSYLDKAGLEYYHSKIKSLLGVNLTRSFNNSLSIDSLNTIDNTSSLSSINIGEIKLFNVRGNSLILPPEGQFCIFSIIETSNGTKAESAILEGGASLNESSALSFKGFYIRIS